MSFFTRVLTSQTVNNMVLGSVRTAMGAAIPTLISCHALPANEATGLLGSVMFLAAWGLSLLDKVVRGEQFKAALATPAPGQVTRIVMPPIADTPAARPGPVTMAPIPNPPE